MATETTPGITAIQNTVRKSSAVALINTMANSGPREAPRVPSDCRRPYAAPRRCCGVMSATSDLAYSTLRRLVERYPDSEYAPDAEQRMIAIKERLAAYENHVADYYLRRGAYVAAANRAKNALEAYNGATGNETSLRIMAEAYDNLGMTDLAADARKVLAENFPNDS